MHAIYLSYDGLNDPLGKSQVLPYVEGLSRLGHTFKVLSFEKYPCPLVADESIGPGIKWSSHRYHHKPTLPATLFDLGVGAARSGYMALRQRPDLLHARSYLAALMAAPWCAATSTPLIFDMRGLWVDERVEGGSLDAASLTARALRRLERVLLRTAWTIVVLTNSMASYLRELAVPGGISAAIRVIPTCVDLTRFSLSVPRDVATEERLRQSTTLVYLGGLGDRYEEVAMANFYLEWRKLVPRSKFLVVSQQNPMIFARVLSASAVQDELVHVSVPQHQVPSVVACGDAGVYFYRDGINTVGISPTKLGEFLALGLPVVGNSVGDAPKVLDDQVGTVVKDLSPCSLRAAARLLVELSGKTATSRRCHEKARQWYSLPDGVAAYHQIYMASRDPDRTMADSAWPPSGNQRPEG